MMQQASLGERFYGEAINHVADIHNRLFTLVLNVSNQMEAILKSVTKNEKLRIFECAEYVRHHNEQRIRKLEARSARDVNLGNENGMHRIYLPGSQRIVLIKDVSMNEQQFPMSGEAKTTTNPSKPLSQSNEKDRITAEEQEKRRMIDQEGEEMKDEKI